MSFLKNFKEDFCGVGCSAIKAELLTTYYDGVPDTSEVHVELVTEVLADHLIENFWNTINRFWLQDYVSWGLYLREVVPSKYSDAARDEDATIVVLSDPECIYNAVNIDIDGKLGVFFTQSRQDAC